MGRFITEVAIKSFKGGAESYINGLRNTAFKGKSASKSLDAKVGDLDGQLNYDYLHPENNVVMLNKGIHHARTKILRSMAGEINAKTIARIRRSNLPEDVKKKMIDRAKNRSGYSSIGTVLSHELAHNELEELYNLLIKQGRITLEERRRIDRLRNIIKEKYGYEGYRGLMDEVRARIAQIKKKDRGNKLDNGVPSKRDVLRISAKDVANAEIKAIRNEDRIGYVQDDDFPMITKIPEWFEYETDAANIKGNRAANKAFVRQLKRKFMKFRDNSRVSGLGYSKDLEREALRRAKGRGLPYRIEGVYNVVNGSRYITE